MYMYIRTCTCTCNDQNHCFTPVTHPGFESTDLPRSIAQRNVLRLHAPVRESVHVCVCVCVYVCGWSGGGVLVGACV